MISSDELREEMVKLGFTVYPCASMYDPNVVMTCIFSYKIPINGVQEEYYFMKLGRDNVMCNEWKVYIPAKIIMNVNSKQITLLNSSGVKVSTWGEFDCYQLDQDKEILERAREILQQIKGFCVEAKLKEIENEFV